MKGSLRLAILGYSRAYTPSVTLNEYIGNIQDGNVKKSGASQGESASELISKRIAELGDWRGEALSRMRKLIKEADPDVVEEWKWMGTPRSPSGRPQQFRQVETFEESEVLRDFASSACTTPVTPPIATSAHSRPG